jgi:Flp pilus assembly protein TadD
MVAKARLAGLAFAGAALLGGCVTDSDKGQSLNPPAEARALLAQNDKITRPNDPANGADYYRGLYQRDPTNTAAAIGLLQNLRDMGSFDQARESAGKMLAANPDQPALVAELGKIELAAGRLKEAVQALERAIASDGRDWKSHSALGVAYDRQGEYVRAETAYREALALAPDNPTVLNNLALSKAMAGDLPGAQTLLQRASSANSADTRVRQNYALVLALGGDIAQAEELTRRDLPPDLARDTIAYYRELAAGAAKK